MSSIESIVPPVELCKRIPAGEFEDSALVHRFNHQQAGEMFPKTNDDNSFYYVEEREIVEFAQRNMVNPPPMFPAPTLEEILRALPARDRNDNKLKISPHHPGDSLAVGYTWQNLEIDRNLAAAALRLWFKINRCF